MKKIELFFTFFSIVGCILVLGYFLNANKINQIKSGIITPTKNEIDQKNNVTVTSNIPNVKIDTVYFQNETKIPINFLVDNYVGFKISEQNYLLSEMKKYEKINVIAISNPENLSFIFKNNNKVYFAFGFKIQNKNVDISIYADLDEQDKITSRLNNALLFATYIIQNQENSFSENESVVKNIYLNNINTINFFEL